MGVKHVIIKAENYDYPYSKGLLATRMMVTGLDLADAYKTAEAIALEMELQDIWELTEDELNNLVSEILDKEGKKKHANRYRNFLKFKDRYEPLIVLIGGATGIGKSTIALNLAARLAISHIVGTDTIREVMRKVLSPELVPSLHSSSYAAHESMKEYVSPIYNKIIIGFEEQARLVVSGIESVIDRALTEGISIIIDGVHILPSIIDPKILKSPNIIPVFLYLSNAETHMKRFHERAKTKVMRKPLEDYLDHFDGIRTIQDHLLEQARLHGIPSIENILIETTIRQVLDIVFERIEMLIATPLTT
ncbi:MAG: 2-phosphoglycerate kinase [Promethearchaeota archaeon]